MGEQKPITNEARRDAASQIRAGVNRLAGGSLETRQTDFKAIKPVGETACHVIDNSEFAQRTAIYYERIAAGGSLDFDDLCAILRLISWSPDDVTSIVQQWERINSEYGPRLVLACAECELKFRENHRHPLADVTSDIGIIADATGSAESALAAANATLAARCKKMSIPGEWDDGSDAKIESFDYHSAKLSEVARRPLVMHRYEDGGVAYLQAAVDDHEILYYSMRIDRQVISNLMHLAAATRSAECVKKMASLLERHPDEELSLFLMSAISEAVALAKSGKRGGRKLEKNMNAEDLCNNAMLLFEMYAHKGSTAVERQVLMHNILQGVVNELDGSPSGIGMQEFLRRRIEKFEEWEMPRIKGQPAIKGK